MRIARCIDREWLIANDEDRALYLRLLGSAVTRSDWLCFAYSLMSNHIHLGFVGGRVPLGSLLKRVNSPFARWTNANVDRIGPMFADRPAAWEIRRANVGRLIAYIHNNPVRAGVVASAAESSWTSHHAYID